MYGGIAIKLAIAKLNIDAIDILAKLNDRPKAPAKIAWESAPGHSDRRAMPVASVKLLPATAERCPSGERTI